MPHARLTGIESAAKPGRNDVIDRFFAANPKEAEKYLDHPYFEARVLAAKHASVFLLLPLLADAEPDVRAMVAHRLPVNRIAWLRADPDRKVRMVVAQRLEGAALIPMLGDSDYAVRLATVKRVSADALPIAMRDPDPQVRREVAWAERDTAREVAPRKGKKFRRHGNFLPVASLVFAIPLSAIGAVNDQLAGLLVTWAGIVGVNVASAWSQRHADARHDRDDRDRDLDRWE